MTQWKVFYRSIVGFNHVIPIVADTVTEAEDLTIINRHKDKKECFLTKNVFSLTRNATT